MYSRVQVPIYHTIRVVWWIRRIEKTPILWNIAVVAEGELIQPRVNPHGGIHTSLVVYLYPPVVVMARKSRSSRNLLGSRTLRDKHSANRWTGQSPDFLQNNSIVSCSGSARQIYLLQAKSTMSPAQMYLECFGACLLLSCYPLGLVMSFDNFSSVRFGVFFFAAPALRAGHVRDQCGLWNRNKEMYNAWFWEAAVPKNLQAWTECVPNSPFVYRFSLPWIYMFWKSFKTQFFAVIKQLRSTGVFPSFFLVCGTFCS